MHDVNLMADEEADVDTPRPKYPELRVKLYDASRRPLQDEARVIVEWPIGSIMADTVRPPASEAVFHLNSQSQGVVLKVRALPERHRSVAKFVRLAWGCNTVALHCPVKPEAVKQVRFFPVLGGFGEFSSEPCDSRVGLWNILAKMKGTMALGQSVASGVFRVAGLAPDRVWFEGTPTLFDAVNRSVDDERWTRASSALHPAPEFLRGRKFRDRSSFKTCDRYGNLQLTFFGDPSAPVVEADIDDASGIEHLFQVLRNALPGVSTNPYDIGEILRFHQELDPGYELVL